ncbi:MAG: response regulator [Rhodocyclaceae bacterium]|nr:response regulator [Rhodocyclaceae bacterium]MDZ4214909.1 response regulator [Rhodocyclaceae bacterium]
MEQQTAKRTVLVVDDTPENIDLLKGILSPEYAIKVATNGRLALKLVTLAPKPDLILLDVMMPDMDGYAVCQQLKANEETRSIPVIFITAKGEVEDVAHGFALGAADYITKPISAPIVLARVRTHMSLHDERLHLEDLVRERTRQMETLQAELILQLGRAAEFRDNETSAHTMRMAHFTQALALEAGMNPSQAEMLRLAAMMHDVGKIGIPDDILLKPGKLTAEEFDVMKRHCEIGVKILGDHDMELLRMAREIALTHHEKWSGAGYPRGLKGENIPLIGRISAIADVFDALTSPRPYKKPWSVEDAFDLIRKEAGEHFDPRLAELFLSMEPKLREIQNTFKDAE